MSNKGTMTIFIEEKRKFETKRMMARKAVKNLEKMMSRTQRKEIRLDATICITTCRVCNSHTLTIEWKISKSNMPSYKYIISYFDFCRKCMYK